MGKKIAVIITAGGRGKRFGDSLPKQFHPLIRKRKSVPVLIWAAMQFNSHPIISELIINVPADFISHTKKLVSNFKLNKVARVVPGGTTRSDSVYKSLWYLTQNPPDLVLIHDAVRPFVTHDVIDRVIEGLTRYRAVVPAVEVSDTVRRKGRGMLLGNLEERNSLLLIQAPQGFRWDAIKAALPRWNRMRSATDDATIVMEHGVRVGVVEGSSNNFKITSHEDLLLAKSVAREWRSD